MKLIQGFPQCSAASEKIIWNDDDSIYGIDIPAWKQIINEVNCDEKDCPDYCKDKYSGVFVKGVNKKLCYSYEKLDSICLVVKYDNLKDEYSYHGGCFPENKVYKLVPATPGEEDNFYNVEIEIREFNDPITQAGELTDYEYNFGLFWRYISFFFKLILLADIVFLGYVAYTIYELKTENKNIPNQNDPLANHENDKDPENNI
jgi:hypothetical protein